MRKHDVLATRGLLRTLIAVAVALVFLLPFLWAISLSVRPPSMTFAVEGWGLPVLDFAPTADGWHAMLAEGRLAPAIGRSTLVSLAATALAIGLGAPAAWALARAPFAGVGLVLVGFLTIRLLPPVLLAVPLYPIFQRLGLGDSALALILIDTLLLLPFVIAILRGAFREVPVELEQAAALDGANSLQIFWRIGLPLVLPAVAATALIVFAFAWNEFLFALAFFVRDFYTLPLLVHGWTSPSPTAAAYLLVTISVPIALALAAQRYLVRGLTLGALKS